MAFKLFPKNSAFFKEKKQKILLIVLGLSVVVALIILYFGIWRSPASEPAEPAGDIAAPGTDLDLGTPVSSSPSSPDPETAFKKIDFDARFLKDPLFKDLEIYSEWPLKIEQKGRTNPFLPY
jgi:hypothetical protein